MKKNYFFSLWLRAFSCTTTMTMLFTALMALMFNNTKAFAQTSGTQNEALEEKSTGRTVIGGVDDLYGVDPSSAICTNLGTNETNGDKIVCLYNVGAKKFLSVGGMWGTHATLDVTPYSIYMVWNNGSQTYFLESKVKGSATHPYLGIDNNHGEVFMDTYDGQKSAIRFDQAKDYSETNKVYLVRIGNTTTLGYLTAYPDNEKKLCDYQKDIAQVGTQEYKNQEWKVITKNEYYELFNVAPANMTSAVDASFIITCPDFRVNDADAQKWEITCKNLPTTDLDSHVYFGDGNMYKTRDKLTQTGSGAWVNYKEDYQNKYGQYFYCYTKDLRGFQFYQDIKVHKAGWYLLRCNGFTTQVNDKGRVSARLMMAVVKNGSIDKTGVYSAATLNKLSVDDATTLMGKDKDGTGAGRAFFDGKYENQVQVCLDDKDWVTKISETNPVTLRIGYYVGDDCVLHDGDVTCVDNFKLLYAGPRRDPELILDEDQTSLLYLTNAKDTYKNSVLHLNRTLKEGQWNSLILPVNLKFGQMKRTFGDDVKVAKLTRLQDGVVTFTTVEPKQDSDVMVTAFEPYIIKPTSLTEDMGLAYTAEKFYTKLDKATGEISNAEWLAADGKSVSTDDNNRFELTIPAGHYDITMVSLDRNELIKHLNLREEDKTNYVNNGDWENINWDKVNWISSTSFSTGATKGDLTCYGTLTKTYKDDNGTGVILPGRDDLSDDYVMRDGKIVHVPHNQKYGLKGFRCWFEVKGSHPIAAAPRLEIDGIIDDATSIDDLNSQPSQFTSRHKGISGVFNLDGQKVRDGESTQDLPKGIYIVNGRKVVVR